MLIKNANIYLPKLISHADIRFSNVCQEIGDFSDTPDWDAHGGYLLPGLVDIHTHGALGEDASDGSDAGLHRMAQWYASHGVTSFLATTMTLKEPELSAAMDTIREFRPSPTEARCAGVHLEGPFLSYAKRGAQNPDNLHKPDIELFHRLNQRSGGAVRLLTVACEEPGAMELIREASSVCTVSLGHSTADYETAMKAFEAGARHVTHLFNGMSPLHHRDPGIIGAALDDLDHRINVELICDGLHVHPSVVRAVFTLFGDRVNLISDSLRCAGMPDGDYTLGGQSFRVSGGKATLPDGTLAGSSISLLEGLQRAVSYGVPLVDAIYCATTAPAAAANIDAGVIGPGWPADFILLDLNLNLQAVWIGGQLAYKAPRALL